MKENNGYYDIEVQVTSRYLAEQSDPEASRYVFAYHVTIHNGGAKAAKLVSRHWIITDSNNQVQEVKGEGVVGEQPNILPGSRYEYTSGCVLNTEVGTMEGSYQMQGEDGAAFEADIPRFTLSLPRTLH